MSKNRWVWLLCLAIVYLPWISAHSINNRKLERVEPLNAVALDIAPRPETFFEKRSLTANPAYVPKSPRAIEYDDILRLTLTAYNQTFHLHLHPNTDLFHPNAVVNYGGYEERIRPQDYRVYRGLVIDPAYSDDRWKEDQAGVWRDELAAEHEPGVLGWARIIIRHDIRHDLEYPIFEGSFEVYGDIHHVKVAHNYKRVKRSDDAELQEHHENTHMVIYRDSDTKVVRLEKRGENDAEPVPECGFDRLLYKDMPSTSFGHPAAMSSYFGSLSQGQLFGSIGSHSLLSKRAPEGCPTSTKINYMGAAADCTYTKHYQSATNARTQIINDWNSASAVYQRTFNVQLGLINITIMPETCPSSPSSSAPWNQGCSTSYTVSDRLSDFSRWRGSLGDDGAGLWHLMTSCATGIEVGVAWLGKLCDKDATAQTTSGKTDYVSGTGLSSIIRDEWKVVAHEIGHNFGAIHDCTSDTCPCSGSCTQCCPLSSTQCDAGGTYIMNPSSNVSTNDFSPCTIKMICDNFPTLGTCLEDPGSRTIKTLQMCGNGIKEEGEDCDPGGQNSTSNCCDPKTCKYINNAQCDDTTDLCCNNCQYRPANYTCRPAVSECDVAEVCSGDSGDCPSDSFVTDGESCGNGLYCASGQCTSRDLQCRQRGSVMNVTRACGAIDGCQLACDNPHGFGCILFNGNFLDGTPCGVGGACKAGSCSLDNFGTNAKNWINDHLYIVIPVAAVVGLLLLCCISRCILYGCCGYGGYRAVNKGGYVVTTAPQQPYSAYPPPYSAQPYYAPPPHSGSSAPGHWVDPSQYNGTGPTLPSAAYAPGPGQIREAYEMNSPETWRSNSVSPAPRDGGSNGNISGRVRRFEEQMGSH